MMLTELLQKYANKFGDGFPMYQLGRGRSDSEIEDIINNCLAQEKDVYELGYVTDDEGVDY